MELKKFLNIIKKNIIFILLLALFAGFISFFSSGLFSSGYSQSRLFFIAQSISQIPPGQGYNFEGFYTQEKSRNFTDTAVAILESSDFANEVLNPQNSLSVRKVAPQVVRITISAQTPQSLNGEIEKIASEFNSKISHLSASTQSAELKPVGEASELTFLGLNSKILFVFGLLLGTTFALFIIGLKNYFKL